jgi:hypothetical protein
LLPESLSHEAIAVDSAYVGCLNMVDHPLAQTAGLHIYHFWKNPNNYSFRTNEAVGGFALHPLGSLFHAAVLSTVAL